MRQSLFAGRRLRASYRGFSSDFVLALLETVDEQGDTFCCLHRPRTRRSFLKEEQ
jgi:hypothetical protein